MRQAHKTDSLPEEAEQGTIAAGSLGPEMGKQSRRRWQETKRIESDIQCQGNASTEIRCDAMLAKAAAASEKRKVNKLMQSTGIDYSAAALGKVPFNELTAALHKDAILQELVVRKITFANNNWNTLGRDLQEAEQLGPNKEKIFLSNDRIFQRLSQVVEYNTYG